MKPVVNSVHCILSFNGFDRLNSRDCADDFSVLGLMMLMKLIPGLDSASKPRVFYIVVRRTNRVVDSNMLFYFTSHNLI